MEFIVEFSDRTFENKKRKSEEYREISLEIRKDIIKSLLLAKSGHSGGPLGITDLLTVLFFGGYMNYNPKNPQLPERDRFVLSSGHMAPVLYSVLARAGYFETDELKTLRKYGTRLQGHPGLDVKLPGVETSSGSLGQGISIALGMAISDFIIDKNSRKVFSITGDGELQEGICWETAMTAGTLGLENFCWIVDNNDCQIDGRVKNIMSIYPLKEKFEAFKFDVIEIDGNDYEQIIFALDKFNQNIENHIGKPTCIIAKTIMGKGVTFMSDNYKWHGNPPNEQQAVQALEELI